jgi:hypothetical protein
VYLTGHAKQLIESCTGFLCVCGCVFTITYKVYFCWGLFCHRVLKYLFENSYKSGRIDVQRSSQKTAADEVDELGCLVPIPAKQQLTARRFANN